ncbi:MAG: hypothetical protein NWE91_02720 [Candidatus Bathyarchaeota archaeon]|nr:hypothetical protein [Candidatus Bathyarchaeota archaeon]
MLAGDSLLDPIYLTKIAIMLKAFGAIAAVNKVDYLYLQALHGGDIPDIDGVAGIDADYTYQDTIIEQNDRSLEDIMSPTTTIASERGSLALTHALIEHRIFELYNFGNNYPDGICFLQTGDPNKGSSKPAHEQKPSFYGEGSLVGDVLFGTPESLQWRSFLEKLPVQYSEDLSTADFSNRQIWTRVAAVGRCARTKEPLLTHSSWTADWLQKADLMKFSRLPIEEACPILNQTVTSQASRLTVEAFAASLDDLIAQALIRDAVEELKRIDHQMQRARREDSLLLILKLIVSGVAGVVSLHPAVGSAVTLCSYLYQRLRFLGK